MDLDREATWGQVWEQLQVLFRLYASDLGYALSPLNVIATLALCLVLWRLAKPGQGFLAWVFPARVYRGPSFRIDLAMMVLNWTIDLFVRVNFAAIATLTAVGAGSLFGLDPAGPEDRSPILSALIVFLVADLTLYWFHRLNHQRPVLWAFHALHHSAEEMSPVTAFRHHPIYSVATAVIVSVTVGVVQGLAMAFFIGNLDVAVLAGTNAFIAILNLATNNLKHSHIWMRYPRWLEHVLISPALHQVHHSVDPRHHDRNYGDILAVWDWMFGTLYLPQKEERVRFGLGDRQGQPLEQRHPTIGKALSEPLFRASRVLRREK